MSKGSQNGKDLAKQKRQVLDLERKKRMLEKEMNKTLHKIQKKENDTTIQNTFSKR